MPATMSPPRSPKPPTKRKQGPPPPPPGLRASTPRCFRCDGTGKLCNVCGEAPATCRCDGTDVDNDEQWYACDDCGGTGR